MLGENHTFCPLSSLMWWFVLFYSGRTVRHYWSDLHTHTLRISTGFEDFSPFGSPGKESACQRRKRKRLEFHLWAGKIPWRRAWPPTPVFLTGEFHGQRSLAGYSPWGHRAGLGWATNTHTHTHTHTHIEVEVESRDGTELLQSHDKTWMDEELLQMDKQRR